MRKIVSIIIGCTALAQMSGLAQAQELPSLLTQAEATMQDIENSALRNTMNRVASSADAAPNSGQGNVFYGVQDGMYNRIDATQTGIGNVIRISQSGMSNNAVITQSGSYNQITLRQGR
ncbi:MAG TPA: curlin repeat-containing protein [Methylobacterium sp.]|jgi:hypothetical protein|uniref:curlin repeat-containing protein n=1 Tax=Methylorubrum sp. B1-46 TaxID=2897334 RepID=UPI001E36F4F9|nr:curlin repeat-containing protein [Methylorubrum sp. B1-46]UGB26090.1 curlin repeat-containing protein [Methylorubrum sp. B1-46]HEV2543690.1 curlin repeat-containing protein [Methylobacterium sp.]